MYKRQHLDRLTSLGEKMNALDLESVHFESANGTDLTLSLIHIFNELNDVAKKYAQPRRSEILYDLPEEESGAEEESIPDYPVTCLLYTSIPRQGKQVQILPYTSSSEWNNRKRPEKQV